MRGSGDGGKVNQFFRHQIFTLSSNVVYIIILINKKPKDKLSRKLVLKSNFNRTMLY